jgi:hypothetical protein
VFSYAGLLPAGIYGYLWWASQGAGALTISFLELVRRPYFKSELRIRIRIILGRLIRIRIRVISWIRIRIEVKHSELKMLKTEL